MSNEIYRAQAARLVKFLSEQHKFRLKQASSLEAIAAIHGVRNWNTLIASGSESIGRTPEVSARENPVDAGSVLDVSSEFASEGIEKVALLDLSEPVSPESLENRVADGLLNSDEPGNYHALSAYGRHGWRKGSRLYLPELKVRDDMIGRFSEHLKKLMLQHPGARHSVTSGILKGFANAGWLVTRADGWALDPELALWNIRTGMFEWKNMIILDLPESVFDSMKMEESALNIAITGPLTVSS
jgi:hypothetical protein